MSEGFLQVQVQILKSHCDAAHDLVPIEVPSDEFSLFVAFRYDNLSEGHSSLALVVDLGSSDIEVHQRQVVELEVLVDHVHRCNETHLHCVLDVIRAEGCFLEKTLRLAAGARTEE